MSMKKFMFAAMAALAITGCSQNEEFDAPGSKSEIKIGSIVSKATRAAITDMAALQKTGFTVYAYNVGTAGTDKLTNTIMNGALATAPEGVWGIAGGPYYWPLNEKVNFFAYPTGVSAAYAVAVDATSPTIDYTIVDEPADQIDLVLAKVIDQVKSDNAITLPFSHVLTQINFAVKGADKYKYVVSSVGIEGVAKAGKYSYADDSWATVGELTGGYTYAIAANASVTGTTAVNLDQENGALMLMPQAMTAAAKIKLMYEVYDGDALLYSTPEEGVKIDLLGSAAWESGKKVRYTLTLANGAATIKLTPEVGSWNENDDSTEELPKP